jgi:peptide-methionine (R)-S-oxide reductase
MFDRRKAVFGAAALAITGWAVMRSSGKSSAKSAAKSSAATDKKFEIVKSDAEWRQQLTPSQYHVLRKHGTERPYTSPLNKIETAGTYACAGCGLGLFSSKHKYDSGTGWPSFWQPLPGAIGKSTDYWLGYPRTEVHCRRCGGHQGHVFKDGPQPTGLRYCINGVSLKFVPA